MTILYGHSKGSVWTHPKERDLNPWCNGFRKNSPGVFHMMNSIILRSSSLNRRNLKKKCHFSEVQNQPVKSQPSWVANLWANHPWVSSRLGDKAQLCHSCWTPMGHQWILSRDGAWSTWIFCPLLFHSHQLFRPIFSEKWSEEIRFFVHSIVNISINDSS